MLLLEIPERMRNVMDNANHSMTELRTSVTTVLYPLKFLLWCCIVAVAVEAYRGSLAYDSVAYRTIAGAIDQLWYVIFYCSVPAMLNSSQQVVSQLRAQREWVVIKHDMDRIEEEEWVIVNL